MFCSLCLSLCKAPCDTKEVRIQASRSFESETKLENPSMGYNLMLAAMIDSHSLHSLSETGTSSLLLLNCKLAPFGLYTRSHTGLAYIGMPRNSNKRSNRKAWHLVMDMHAMFCVFGHSTLDSQVVCYTVSGAREEKRQPMPQIFRTFWGASCPAVPCSPGSKMERV